MFRAARVPALIALFSMCVIGSGCSLVFMERVPDDYERGAEPKCADEKDMPYADLVIGGIEAGVGVGTGIAAIGGDAGTRLTLGAALLGLAVAHGYSALKGLKWAKQCKRVKAEHAAM